MTKVDQSTEMSPIVVRDLDLVYPPNSAEDSIGGSRGYTPDTVINNQQVQNITGNYQSMISPFQNQLLFPSNCTRLPTTIPLQLHQV